MGGRGASVKSIIAKYENHKKKISNSSSAITRAERKKLIEAGYLKREEKKATPKSESKNSFDRAKILLTEQKKLKTLAIMITEKKILQEGLSLLLQCFRKTAA